MDHQNPSVKGSQLHKILINAAKVLIDTAKVRSRTPRRSCTCLLVDLLNKPQVVVTLLVVAHTNTVKVPIEQKPNLKTQAVEIKPTKKLDSPTMSHWTTYSTETCFDSFETKQRVYRLWSFLMTKLKIHVFNGIVSLYKTISFCLQTKCRAYNYSIDVLAVANSQLESHHIFCLGCLSINIIF